MVRNVDMLSVLVDWVEHNKAPGDLVVTEQSIERNRSESLAPASMPVARLAEVQGG
jgi:hypothetical protein